MNDNMNREKRKTREKCNIDKMNENPVHPAILSKKSLSCFSRFSRFHSSSTMIFYDF